MLMRIMGLDYGDKNIGVALCDELHVIAYGVEVIKKKSLKTFAPETERIKELVINYQVDKIVLGFPKNLDGTVGFQAKIILEFKKCLYNSLRNIYGIAIEILLWDERMSSRLVEKTFSRNGINTRKQKSIKDKIAAVFILQGYLDYVNHKERG